MKLYRICGYGSGRSALVIRLVEDFVFRGVRVAVLKHAHKPFDMDKQGSDTWNLRQSGCAQTLIAHNDRWGLLCDTPGGAEPDPVTLARHLAPCDLALVVGFDHAPLPGLEVRRAENTDAPLYLQDHRILAVVADGGPLPQDRQVFAPDSIEAIASHILEAAAPLPS